MKLSTFAAVAGAGFAAAAPGLANADISLPKQLAWTAYDAGSAAYSQSVAIGEALKDRLDTELRVLPVVDDAARIDPLRRGDVPFSATGVGGSFMAQEGVFDFGAEDWGPQPVRILIANNSGAIGLSLGVAADVGVEEYADLRGKRVAYVTGSPAINVNVSAYLAYAGLTWDDVKKVEFDSFGDSWKGLIDGRVDATGAATNAAQVYEAEIGPRGLIWPPIDPENAEGLERMASVAPYFTPITARVGAMIDGTGGLPTAGYAYPILTTMADQDADLVYNMTKAMVELFDDYKGGAPGIGGWSLDKQDFDWVAPYHDGAIRYYKEIGAWTVEAQANNDLLVARQAALLAAWTELKAEDPEDWDAAWDEKRRAALAAGGFAIVF